MNKGANEQENEGSTTEDTEDVEPKEWKPASPPFSTRLRTGTKHRHGSSFTVNGEQRSPTSPRDCSDQTEALAVSGPTLTKSSTLR